MAKTNITKRPMVIVSVSTQKWDIYKDSKNPLGYCLMKEHKAVNIKQETLKTGRWTIFGGRYYSEYLLPNGSFRSCWSCRRENINFEYPTAKAALKVWAKYKNNTCILRRVRESYYNPVTKEVTFDKKIASNWFKGQNPLFISNTQYQRAGIWVEPGKNYVTIYFYFTNRIQRERSEEWRPGTVTVITNGQIHAVPLTMRLYNDGTVSHFIKGKLRGDRVYEEKRMNYRTLDIRFNELYRLATTFCDLRSKEIIGPNTQTNSLCPETLKILKRCGFPDTYWCWGNTKRPFADTYDLINFATHIQTKEMSKVSQPINEFLKDIPFDKDHLVVPYDKGIILRIPGYTEKWMTPKNGTYDHRPYAYETDYSIDCELLEAGPFERYRVWISNNGKKRSCQELIHERSLWKTTMWSNVHFPSQSERVVNLNDSDLKPDEKTLRSAGYSHFSSLVSISYRQVYDLLDCLKKIKDLEFFKKHPELYEGRQLYELLSAMFSAPKLTETLIKIGYGDWFFEDKSDRYLYSRESSALFSLEKVLNKFNVENRSSYKETAGRSLYANLGVSKAQFQWIAQTEDSAKFMDYFRHKVFRVPGTQSDTYVNFADIPVKYLDVTHATIKKLQQRDHGEYYRSANTVRNLFDRGLCFTDIEKIVKRNLDINTLDDYLRMRAECNTQYRTTLNFNIRDWPLIPSDQTDLQFTHNRILDLYNLSRANVARYWREEEERRMIERQEKYEERYKKLKSMNYTSEESDLIIVVPKKLQELVIEGQILHHCVGSFVASVSEGKDTIVFLRHKDAPEIPYATIALLKNGNNWYIDQAHTAHNGSISEHDLAFLKSWGRENNVLPESIKLNYGLHCHH